MYKCRPHVLLGPKQHYAIKSYYENLNNNQELSNSDNSKESPSSGTGLAS